MESQNKYGSPSSLFRILLLLLMGICLTAPAQAGVELLGWKDLNPGVTPDGNAGKAGTYQYVLLGKYPQLQNAATPLQPILWRILSADQTGTTRKGLLLSEESLRAMAFNVLGGTNYWKDSILRDWMNGTGNTQLMHADYFTMQERGALSKDTHITKDENGNENPLGASSATDTFFALSHQDVLNPEYGFSDRRTVQDVNRLANNTAYAINQGAYPVGRWWIRSPSPFASDQVPNVSENGRLGVGNIINGGRTARPACFLSLGSFLFKSALNDFSTGSSSVDVAGSQHNPYLLLIPSEIPTGAPVGWTTVFVSEDKVPDIAKIDGKFLTLEWGTAVSPAVKNWPAPEDFMLVNGEHPFRVTGDTTNKNALILTFKKGVKYGDPVRISYNLNTDAISFNSTGNPVKVVNSFFSFVVSNDTLPIPSTPNVVPTQARFDGSFPESLDFLLSGAALNAANRSGVSLEAETLDGTRIPLTTGDYSIEARTLTLDKSFLSKLLDGRYTITLHSGTVQVGKITLSVINSSGHTPSDSGSNGCNAGVGTEGVLAMGALLLGLKKAIRRSKG